MRIAMCYASYGRIPSWTFIKEDKLLQTGFAALEKGNVDIQVLACFVP